MKRLKKDSLTRKVLLKFGERCQALLNVSARIVLDPHGLVKDAGVSLYKDHSQSDFSKTINYLKRSKYFEEEDNNKLYLTREGRIAIIQELVKEEAGRRQWDGKWRGIIFDIPESRRKDRDFLRRELQWMNFIELQESIWVFPYDVEQELQCLLRLWKRDFEGDIRLITIENLTPEKDIKENFDVEK